MNKYIPLILSHFHVKSLLKSRLAWSIQLYGKSHDSLLINILNVLQVVKQEEEKDGL